MGSKITFDIVKYAVTFKYYGTKYEYRININSLQIFKENNYSNFTSQNLEPTS